MEKKRAMPFLATVSSIPGEALRDGINVATMRKLPLGRHENDIYLENKPSWEHRRNMLAYQELCLGGNGHVILLLQVNSSKTSRPIRRLKFCPHELAELFILTKLTRDTLVGENTVRLYWFNNDLFWRHWPMTNDTSEV